VAIAFLPFCERCGARVLERGRKFKGFGNEPTPRTPPTRALVFGSCGIYNERKTKDSKARSAAPPWKEGHEYNLEQDATMSTWAWVLVAVAAFLLLSVTVGLGLAAILGRIGREISELLEPELWSSTPNERERDEATQETSSERRRARA
jgi:hypothetical protein